MPGHQYRFRGSIAPTPGVKRPVRAEAAASVEGGVGRLYLDDVIDSWGGDWGISAREFRDALNGLGAVDEIHLHINSPGGEVYEGIAMLNALRRHPAKVTAVVDGLAASAASFIAAGVDELVMAPNAEFMCHDAWGIAIGPAADMHAVGDRLDGISDNIASIYQEKAGGEVAGWRALMLAETWYSATETVEAGLADRIEGDDSGEPAGEGDIVPRNAFDLSVFKHPGRSAAPKPAAAAVDRIDPPPPAPAEDCGRQARFADRREARHTRRATARV